MILSTLGLLFDKIWIKYKFLFYDPTSRVVKNTFFVFELPEIYSRPEFGFQWIKRIGEYIIKEISFFIGSKKIDTITGEWLHIWSELYLDFNKHEGYEKEGKEDDPGPRQANVQIQLKVGLLLLDKQGWT